jgi:dihydroorotase
MTYFTKPRANEGIDTDLIFHQLKIVLEHCTTCEAVEAVNECGPNVVRTITAHHLYHQTSRQVAQ